MALGAQDPAPPGDAGVGEPSRWNTWARPRRLAAIVLVVGWVVTAALSGWIGFFSPGATSSWSLLGAAGFGGLIAALLALAVGLLAHRTQAGSREEIDEGGRAGRVEGGDEDRFRLAADAVADGVWDWNIETGEVYFSDSWVASLGFERAAITPHVSFWEGLVHPDDREALKGALQDYLQGRSPAYEFVNRLRRADGTYRWNRDRGMVVERGDDGRPLRMVGTDTDISDQVAAEEKRKRLEEKMREAQKLESIGLLAGGVAHDFNNLLVGILGNAELAQMEGRSDSGLAECLAQIQASATRAAELTRQLLDYAGHGSCAPERLDLALVIDEMLPLLATSISVDATLDRGRMETAEVEADPAQIRQVVMNLITNASDSIPEGSPGKIEVQTGVVEAGESFFQGAVLGAADPGSYAFLEIKDDGCGMDEETAARLFDPFFTTRTQGRGLGMAAVSGIVRRHGGNIRVRTTPGSGTSITVLLPRARTPAPGETAPSPISSTPPAATSTAGAAAPPGRPPTVLVVDDERAVRLVVQRVLEQEGCTVLTACDGVEGVGVFRREADGIDLVILDARMPQMGGAEAFRLISAIKPDIPVILSSGYTEEETLAEFGPEERVRFLPKPFSFDGLVGQVRACLRGVSVGRSDPLGGTETRG